MGKKHTWEIIDRICKEKINSIDYNLNKMKKFIKPQAQQLHYTRKADFLNLVIEKQEQEEEHIKHYFKKYSEYDLIEHYKKKMQELRRIMVKFNIKHPLRGEE